MPVKVGILTHHYIKNYGAFLQAYALMKCIEERYEGAQVCIINYRCGLHELVNTCGFIRVNPRSECIRSYIEKLLVPHSFRRAEKEYLMLSRRVYSAKDINRLDLDCVIIGSDEVWNYQSLAKSRIKFGCGLTSKVLAAYAPSTGGAVIYDKLPDYIEDGMHSFTHLSARDDNSQKLIEQCLNKKAVRVLDPTLMYDIKVNNNGLGSQLEKNGYILMYYCGQLSSEVIQTITDYARNNELKIYGAGEYANYYSDITVNIDPFEWVAMFENARFVFTGTFHGVVFSLMKKRAFAAFLTNESRIKKVTSLLKQFDKEERIVREQNRESILTLLNANVDYSMIGSIMQGLRRESFEYLDYVMEGGYACLSDNGS